ncbi:parallel beta helix pectate lyase-like protein [Jejuia pallidilutea]|uniref:Parallel beta helix pectate lyase-like protein n=1 Tax=Jejuia pallidilutea TaxID=504487 RepID=A0A362X463_9FLAO|nr:right-handed parallel beta-helix repeat-containing protein [Jejuia pallidilutea]PQV51527.1 parallel beta helix pectate lyase-like protein [Jejuia pallidilutea]
MRHFSFLIFLILGNINIHATDYYFHPKTGSNSNTGLTEVDAFKTLDALQNIKLKAGDRILLASEVVHFGSIKIVDTDGTKEKPIKILSHSWLGQAMKTEKAIIDFKGMDTGILIENSSNVSIENLAITGNGHGQELNSNAMSCGILITSSKTGEMNHIAVKDLFIYDIFNKNQGFVRGAEEVRTANGTQAYGWGIRVKSLCEKGFVAKIKIENTKVQNVGHTGVKLTGKNGNIHDVEILNNHVLFTGGPGIQMSSVKDVHVEGNVVKHSGSNDDSRKWGRGSGLWTWGSSNVLIERNKFLFANGPGDSTGAHIDYNCENIVIQYNLSAYNAGGFCEILGNNYNCIYRFNVSVNDGWRVKDENGAFQEGKIFWLSGYQGNHRVEKGPVNTYFYNNTIYTDGSYTPKIAIEKTSNGILIANNIFAVNGKTKLVEEDQYGSEKVKDQIVKNVFFSNNIFISHDSWPEDIYPSDTNPIYGDPKFLNPNGLSLESYIPNNIELVSKGIFIQKMQNDSNSIGAKNNHTMFYDILDQEIKNLKFIGAIKP